ncbi:MAG: HlyD family secretion protein [Bacteroidales bacterium]|nr:HlyD family secretion protein [Bacteroidales bacterium]
MSTKSHNIRHSTPVEEIMGNPPSAVVRWGITVIALIFLLAVAASWFIRYPYIITAEVEITTDNPPANMMAMVSGKIEKLFIDDGDNVSYNEILALLQTAASYESVIWLSSLLDTIKQPDSKASFNFGAFNLPDNPGLGELQAQYSSFRKSASDLFNHIEIDAYGKRAGAIKAEINSIDNYIKQLKTKESLYSEKLILESKKFSRDSLLYSQSVLAEAEYEISRQNYYIEMIQLQQVRLDVSSKNIERASRFQEMQDVISSGLEEMEKLKSLMENELLKLRSELDIWIMSHLLISPIDGKVTFTRFWGENQVVREGENAMTVVPSGETTIIAKIYLPMAGSGKVKPGQDVFIKLSGYPYLEFGMVKGIVSSKSLVPQSDMYVLDVELPDGLRTFYGKNLEFTQNMSGVAEIITEDMRLIERVIYPFKYLIEKNRSRL